MEALRRVLSGGTTLAFESVDAFWAYHVGYTESFELPVQRALLGGATADRLGYAFAAGYAAALQALFRTSAATLGSLAATEEGGAHPRAINTTLRSEGGALRLSGHKRWITLAGEELFVLARTEETNEGRPVLVVVRIDRDDEGVRVVPMPEAPFVPEIPHAELVLENVEVAPSNVLPGDGWNDWVKPFRTVEDIHVHAAVLGYLLGAAGRFAWPRDLRERAASIFASLRMLSQEFPSAATTHLALAGAIAETHALMKAMGPHWANAPAEERARWDRDRALFGVAEKARTQRTERAWSQLKG